MKRRSLLHSPEAVLFLIIFVIALLIRLVYLFLARDKMLLGINVLPGTDMKEFYDTAIKIADGGSPPSPFYQAPLYSHLIAFLFKISGRDYFNFLILQSIIGSLSVGLIFLLGNRMFNRQTGLIAAVAGSIYSPFIFYEGILLRVTLMVFLCLLLLLVLLIALEKNTSLIWSTSGILLGLATLGRANLLLLTPFVCLWSWFVLRDRCERRITYRHISLFLLGIVIIISPITIRNYIVGNRFILISANGPVTWRIGNSYDSTGTYMETKKPLIPVFSKDFWMLQYKKFKLFWGDYEVPNNVNYYLFKSYLGILGITSFLSFKIFLSLGIAGIIVTYKRWKDYLLFYIFIIVYSFSIILFISLSRLRQPVVPVLILFSAACIHWLMEKIKEREYLIPGIVTSFIIAGCILLSPPSDHIFIQPNHHFNLGNVFLINGDRKRATEEKMLAFEKAVKIFPHNTELRKNVAIAYEKLGNYRKAIAHWNGYLQEVKGIKERESARERVTKLEEMIRVE